MLRLVLSCMVVSTTKKNKKKIKKKELMQEQLHYLESKNRRLRLVLTGMAVDVFLLLGSQKTQKKTKWVEKPTKNIKKELVQV